MKKNNSRRLIILIALCGVALYPNALACAADQIPALAEIPKGISTEQQAKLIKQKQALENEFKSFQAVASTFNAKAAENQTDQEYDSLQMQRSHYIQSATTFNQEVDSSLVDARNVPSGLPKAVESAIASAYADAPSGVSDRVRKGFQAVMDHDWEVAKAWFQDALNHDPKNLGLKRLVALSQYTHQRKSQTPTPADAKLTDKRISRTLAELEVIEDNKAAEELNRVLNDFYRNYLPKHPELGNQKSAPGAPDSTPKMTGDSNADKEINTSWQQIIIELFTPRKPSWNPPNVSAPRG